MKGDFSRYTGLKAKRKHFSGVLKQQGRVQLDSDWNELVSIDAHQLKTRTIDAIGMTGAPIHDSGFQILHPGNGLTDLFITAGRMYVGGLLCETSPCSKLPITSFISGTEIGLDDLQIDGIKLQSGQWVHLRSKENPVGLITKISTVKTSSLVLGTSISSFNGNTDPVLTKITLFSQQADFPNAGPYIAVAGQKDIVYLDVWERHLTAIEDPDLREVALGGPDTDTRTKVIAQVKVLPNVGDVTCSSVISKWNDLIKAPNGRLTTSLKDATVPDTPCELGESGGFHGLENRLYRVEIHDLDTAGQATFKWSRDNAAYAYGISEFFEESGGSVFQINLTQNGKDKLLKIQPQDWIEVSGDETDLDTNTTGTLAQVLKVEGNLLTLDTDVSAHKDEQHAKVRRWDISDQRPDVLTSIVIGTKFELEDGVEITFTGSEFRLGSYWQFAARTLTGTIELLEKEAPMGVHHHFCKLAVLTGLTNNNISIENCRPEFPPLTELPESGDCDCCTITISPKPDWWGIFNTFIENQDIHICFEPGEYILEKTLEIKSLGNIIMTGAGKGSHIIIRNQEAALRFINCKDVVLRDLMVQSLASHEEVEEHLLNGAVTIYDCQDVVLEQMTLICAHSNSTQREATCLTVRYSSSVENEKNPIPKKVSLQHNECIVGAFQTGILVINAAFSHIEGNRVVPLVYAPKGIIYQGIVVAGDQGRHIVVRDNLVEGVLQGIHLGFSNEKLNTKDEFQQADTIQITGNHIQVLFLNRAMGEFPRHGIFVGNSNSILVKDNYILLIRGQRIGGEFHGIEIIGHWGRRMIVSQNHLDGDFRKFGIIVDAFPVFPNQPLWLVSENVAKVQANDPQVILRDNV